MTTALGGSNLEKKVHETVLRLQEGDLTAMPVDAFVFYAREDLQLGSGYGTAIQSRGGISIREELDRVGHLDMGQAIITGAGKLQAKHIIHVCGPKFQEPETEQKLRQAMRSALTIAEEHQLRTIAFPPLGAGFYGVPLDLCARVMVETLRDFLEKPTTLKEITICVVDRRDFAGMQKRIEAW